MVLPRRKLPALAFAIFRDFGDRLRGQKILIACSGGLDSVTLVDVLVKLAPRLQLNLAIAHIHHGRSNSPEVTHARSAARDATRRLAKLRGLPFYSREAAFDLTLSSEADLRKFRRQALDEILSGERLPFDRVALAHHVDDLFETRLMRLIRGTGAPGLRAMSAFDEKTVRPFLAHRRSEILAFAKQNDLQWLEDPSNKDDVFFRNWIRNNWLPLLEKKRPGAARAFARSLDLLTESIFVSPAETRFENSRGDRLVRRDFHQLSGEEKREQLASLSRIHGLRDFGKSKIIEVLKRLDCLELKCQREAVFQVGGLIWKLTPYEIETSRVPASPVQAQAVDD
jgi:tRNA(Ile)-lysidine synthase